MDAVGELIMSPMSLNRYSYAAGNPTNFVDPSGMIAEKPGKWDKCAYEEACCGYDITEWFLAELQSMGPGHILISEYLLSTDMG